MKIIRVTTLEAFRAAVQDAPGSFVFDAPLGLGSTDTVMQDALDRGPVTLLSSVPAVAMLSRSETLRAESVRQVRSIAALDKLTPRDGETLVVYKPIPVSPVAQQKVVDALARWPRVALSISCTAMRPEQHKTMYTLSQKYPFIVLRDELFVGGQSNVTP